MNRALTAALLFAAQIFAACASTRPIDQWTPAELAHETRVTELVAKKAAQIVVAKGIARPGDLAAAAAIIEASASGDLPGAFAAGGLVGDDWELVALLVEGRLEAWIGSPNMAAMVSAAARGVRAGAELTDRDVRELEQLEHPKGPQLVGKLWSTSNATTREWYSPPPGMTARA